jgi:hypothetical protein
MSHGKSGGAVVEGGPIVVLAVEGLVVVVTPLVVVAPAVVVVAPSAVVVAPPVVDGEVVVDAAVVVVVAAVVDGAVVVAGFVVDDGGGARMVMTLESVKPPLGWRMSIFHMPGRTVWLTSRQNPPAALVVNSYGPYRWPVA